MKNKYKLGRGFVHFITVGKNSLTFLRNVHLLDSCSAIIYDSKNLD